MIESKSDENSSIPLDFSTVTDASSAILFADAVLRRLDQLSTPRLSAVTSTIAVTSTATSSSSPSCASLAASMNSRATVNEIETERSAPRCERAEDAAIDRALPPLFCAPLAFHEHSTNRRWAARDAVLRASRGGVVLLAKPLLLRLDREAYLIYHSLFLAPRNDDKPVKKSKKRGLAANRNTIPSTSIECRECVFGCFLGSLVKYLLHSNVSNAALARQIHTLLLPVAESVKHVRGFDRRTLCAGLAASHAIRMQMADMPPHHRPHRMHTRNGNAATVIGATASIFVLFSVLSSHRLGSVSPHRVNHDIEWMNLNNSLEQTILRAEESLKQAVPVPSMECVARFEVDAADVEQRALQRAFCAVVVARAFAREHGFGDEQEMRHVLNWFKRAAWPPGETLNGSSHGELLRRLVSSNYYLTAPTPLPPEDGFSVIGLELVPLSSLVADSISCSDDISSESAASSLDSLGSLDGAFATHQIDW